MKKDSWKKRFRKDFKDWVADPSYDISVMIDFISQELKRKREKVLEEIEKNLMDWTDKVYAPQLRRVIKKEFRAILGKEK